MADAARLSPGGQPSTTQPMAGPWDSPKFVTVKRVPRVLPGIGSQQVGFASNPDYDTAEAKAWISEAGAGRPSR
ncbi:hypothetical protein G6F65_022712 [Rhizopus arrhizus]|nr:hypothetical protein G6F65_022712 [Rhizopus arrhizus]